MSDPLAPGDEVECIRQPVGGYGCETVPVVGSVYTVREMMAFDEGIGLRLVEIVNARLLYLNGVNECAFAINYFRPLRNRSTDIEIFRRIDADVFEKVRA